MCRLAVDKNAQRTTAETRPRTPLEDKDVRKKELVGHAKEKVEEQRGSDTKKRKAGSNGSLKKRKTSLFSFSFFLSCPQNGTAEP